VRKAEVPTETEVLSTCNTCRLIPVSHLGLDIGEPLGGFRSMFDRNGIEVVEDDIGRPSISRDDLGRLLTERREREAALVADAARRAAELEAKRPVLVGVPAREGATPYESMLAATGIVTPDQEFGRREPPRFLEEQLEAGAKALAEKRAQTREQNKQRAADKLKKDLQ